MKSIRFSADLLNYNGCRGNICQVNGNIEKYNPKDINDLLNGKIYDEKVIDFRSPLYELGKKLEKMRGSFGNIDVDELVFFGEAESVDLKWWGEIYEYECSREIKKGYMYFNDSNPHRIIRLEGEVTDIENYNEYRFKNFDFYINNDYDNVNIKDAELERIDKAQNHHFFFRAPRPNEEPVNGKLVKFTKAPRFDKRGSRLDDFWSKPISLHSSAVTYIEEIELNCYESHQYKGTRLYLIGIAPKDLTEEEKQHFVEGYPYVNVWESPEFVVNKLKQAGWHL